MSGVEELRGEIEQASRRFQEVNSASSTVPPPRPTMLQRAGGILRSAAEWAGAVSPKYTYGDAHGGLVAAHQILETMSNNTTDRQELKAYLYGMSVLLDELTEMVEQRLDKTAAAYVPLTANFKAAASTLKSAKAKAEQLASTLKLAADMLTAFSKLVGVL